MWQSVLAVAMLGIAMSAIAQQTTGGTSGPAGTRCTITTINTFINYKVDEGWFVGTVPVITASWNTGGQKWTLPVGAKFGRLIKVADKVPINLLVCA